MIWKISEYVQFKLYFREAYTITFNAVKQRLYFCYFRDEINSIQVQVLEIKHLLRIFVPRLCSGPNGMTDLMNHSFFSTIDWNRLKVRTIDPPFKPAVVSDEAFYFDQTFTSKTPKDSPGVPPSATAHELFRGFSYIAPTLLDSGGGESSSITPPLSAVTSATKKTSPLSGLPVKATPFGNEYEMKERIGSGSFSVCHRCVHRSTRQEYAVKVLQRYFALIKTRL